MENPPVTPAHPYGEHGVTDGLPLETSGDVHEDVARTKDIGFGLRCVNMRTDVDTGGAVHGDAQLAFDLVDRHAAVVPQDEVGVTNVASGYRGVAGEIDAEFTVGVVDSRLGERPIDIDGSTLGDANVYSRDGFAGNNVGETPRDPSRRRASDNEHAVIQVLHVDGVDLIAEAGDRVLDAATVVDVNVDIHRDIIEHEQMGLDLVGADGGVGERHAFPIF